MTKAKVLTVEVLNWPWDHSPTECVRILTVDGKKYDLRGSQGHCHGLPLNAVFKIPTTTDRKKAKRFKVTIEEIRRSRNRK